MTEHVNPDDMTPSASTPKLPANLLRDKTELFESVPKTEERLPYIVAYLRRSKKRENISIERQIERAHDYSRRWFGTDVHAFFIDKGKSGTFRNRKDFRRLKDLVKEGKPTALIVEEIDRLGRTMALIAGECEFFKDNGVAVHIVSKNGPVGTADIALNGFMATETLALLLDRTRHGIKKTLDNGGMTARAFGYDKVPDRPAERVVNERLRPIIEWMFRARLDGMTYTTIADVLNAYEPPLKDGKFRGVTIRYMLSNSVYAGLFVYGRYKCTRDPKTDQVTKTPLRHTDWKIVHVPHLQIVPMELYDAVYATLKPAKRGPGGGQTLLSSKVSFGDDPKLGYFIYSKKQFKKHNDTTGRIHPVGNDWLCTFVLDSLRTLLQDNELEASYQARLTIAFEQHANGIVARRKEVESRLCTVDQRLTACLDRNTAASYPAAFLGKRIESLSEEYDRLQSLLATLPTSPRPPLIDPKRRLNLLQAFDETVARMRQADFMLSGLDTTDRQIAEMIRGMVGDVHCATIQGSASVRCIVTFPLDRIFGVMDLGSHSEAETVSFDKILHFPTTTTNFAGFREAMHDCRYALTDEEYGAVLEDNHEAISRVLAADKIRDLRRALDHQMALMALSRTWTWMRMVIPSTERLASFRIVRQIMEGGVWGSVLQTLETRFPERYRQLNVCLKDRLLPMG